MLLFLGHMADNCNIIRLCTVIERSQLLLCMSAFLETFSKKLGMLWLCKLDPNSKTFSLTVCVCMIFFGQTHLKSARGSGSGLKIQVCLDGCPRKVL